MAITSYGGGDRPARVIRLTRRNTTDRYYGIRVDQIVAVEQDDAAPAKSIVHLSGGQAFPVEEGAVEIARAIVGEGLSEPLGRLIEPSTDPEPPKPARKKVIR